MSDAWAARLKAIQGDPPEEDETNQEWENRLKAIQNQDEEPPKSADYDIPTPRRRIIEVESEGDQVRLKNAEEAFIQAALEKEDEPLPDAEPGGPPGVYVRNRSGFPLSMATGSAFATVIQPGEFYRVGTSSDDIPDATAIQVRALISTNMVELVRLDEPPKYDSEFQEYDLVAMAPDNSLRKLGPEDTTTAAIGMVVDPKKTQGGAMKIVATTLNDSRGRPLTVAISGIYEGISVTRAVTPGNSLDRSALLKKSKK